MDHELDVNQQRVSQFKELVKDENFGKIELQKKLDELVI
jgi:hypothetical protein